MRRKRPKKDDGGASRNSSSHLKFLRMLFPGELGGSVVKWNVKVGQEFQAQDVLGKYRLNTPDPSCKPVLDLVADYDGSVAELFYNEGDEVPSVEKDGAKQDLIRISYCQHDIILPEINMCANCGRAPSLMSTVPSAADMKPGSNKRLEGGHVASSAPSRLVQNVAGGTKIIVSRRQAENDRNLVLKRLFNSKKLLLVLDIDHTMLHATDDPRAPAFAASKGFSDHLHTFKLPASDDYQTPDKLHYVMLRPGLAEWLEELSHLYELSIYTAGTRTYAETVAKIFDPDQKLFGRRIISRTDVPELGKIKRLDRVFPVDNSMVLAVDDRSDVWKEDTRNLVTIRPYHFFLGMSDINNSSGPDFDPGAENQVEATVAQKMDHGLKRCGDVLKWVHGKFFGDKSPTLEHQLQGKGRDVKRLLRNIRAKVLRGLDVVVDLDDPNEKYQLSSIATACGCQCSLTIVPSTKVVISRNKGSQLAQAAKQQRLWVVHPDWLHACVHNWNKEPYSHFSIFGLSADTMKAPIEHTPLITTENDSSGDPGAVDQRVKSAKVPPSGKTLSSVAPVKPRVGYDEFGYEIEVPPAQQHPSLATETTENTTALPTKTESSALPGSVQSQNQTHTGPSALPISGAGADADGDGDGDDDGEADANDDDEEDDNDDDDDDEADAMEFLKEAASRMKDSV